MKRSFFLILSSFMMFGGIHQALAQDFVEDPSYAAPEQYQVTAPLPRGYAPVYRECPEEEGVYYVPAYRHWNGIQWVKIPEQGCVSYPGHFYVGPAYGPGWYRRPHWVLNRYRPLYLRGGRHYFPPVIFRGGPWGRPGGPWGRPGGPWGYHGGGYHGGGGHWGGHR